MVARLFNDCNTTEVVIFDPSIVAENMVSIDDFVKDISFHPCLLDEVYVKLLQLHHHDEVFIPRVIMK